MRQNNARLGILLMIATSLVFAAQDGISRHLASEYNVFMVVMIRYWFFASFVLAWSQFANGGIAKVASTNQLFLQIFRGLLLVGEICVMVTAFVYLGLVESLAVFAIYPLIVAALSGPILGEYVGWRRWLAIAAGFVGVMIILQPGLRVFSPYALIPLCSAILFATYNLLTRYASAKDSAATSFFWTGIAGSVAMTLVGIFFWEPMSQTDWAWMGLLCLFGATGHYLLIKCYEVAEAGVVQPFAYLQLVFGSMIGIFVFGELLELPTAIGATIIILAGLFTLWRAKQISHD